VGIPPADGIHCCEEEIYCLGDPQAKIFIILKKQQYAFFDI
jgi:hypothetical protein